MLFELAWGGVDDKRKERIARHGYNSAPHMQILALQRPFDPCKKNGIQETLLLICARRAHKPRPHLMGTDTRKRQ